MSSQYETRVRIRPMQDYMIADVNCFEYLLPDKKLEYKVLNSVHVLALNTSTPTSLSIWYKKEERLYAIKYGAEYVTLKSYREQPIRFDHTTKV